jgi:hypothetical protein
VECLGHRGQSISSLGGAAFQRALEDYWQMRSGNYPDVSLPELPFGGVKRSGYGKELSSLGIEEFVNRKLIFVPNGHSGG